MPRDYVILPDEARGPNRPTREPRVPVHNLEAPISLYDIGCDDEAAGVETALSPGQRAVMQRQAGRRSVKQRSRDASGILLVAILGAAGLGGAAYLARRKSRGS